MSKHFESPQILDNDLSLDLDLHGQSFEDAQASVNSFIKQAISHKARKVKIITGRGNHPNHNNTRGILYKSLPKWLHRFKEHIHYVTNELGAYQIYFHHLGDNLVPKLPKSQKNTYKKKKNFT